jgi:ADP-ribose pyrophosphatase
MAPLPAPEPARHLQTTASLDARKLRFEINQVRLPMGVEGSFGLIKHPGPPWRCRCWRMAGW